MPPLAFTCAGFVRQALLLETWVSNRMLRAVSRLRHRCFALHPSLAPVLQVKVWLGETQAHYYILSRFLISRMLTVTKIPYMKVWGGRCTQRASACVHVMFERRG